MNPVTAANVISGQRTSANLNYPITGDPETDAISGILKVVEDCKIGSEASLRVLHYLTMRYSAVKEAEDMLREELNRGAAVLKAQGSPWTTSGGTVSNTVAEELERFRAQMQQNQQPCAPLSP
jgi:hypothetical protein